LEQRPVAPVHAVRHVLRVLETVDRHGDGVSAGQLARETGLATAELAGLLDVLIRERYVRALPDGALVAGEGLARFGGARRRRDLGGRVREVLAELRDEVGAAVYFGRYEDGEVQILEVADSPETPRVNEWVDFRYAAHASAVGKCLLTQLDHEARRDHLARHRTARLTSRTIVSEQTLLSTLDAHPATAPVLDLQEYAVGTVCAAVPVSAGRTVGCLALSMPVSRAHRLKPAADILSERAAPLLLSLAL
jgi:DNA-binding IclR family transcriptional regulator